MLRLQRRLVRIHFERLLHRGAVASTSSAFCSSSTASLLSLRAQLLQQQNNNIGSRATGIGGRKWVEPIPKKRPQSSAVPGTSPPPVGRRRMTRSPSLQIVQGPIDFRVKGLGGRKWLYQTKEQGTQTPSATGSQTQSVEPTVEKVLPLTVPTRIRQPPKQPTLIDGMMRSLKGPRKSRSQLMATKISPVTNPTPPPPPRPSIFGYDPWSLSTVQANEIITSLGSYLVEPSADLTLKELLLAFEQSLTEYRPKAAENLLNYILYNLLKKDDAIIAFLKRSEELPFLIGLCGQRILSTMPVEDLKLTEILLWNALKTNGFQPTIATVNARLAVWLENGKNWHIGTTLKHVEEVELLQSDAKTWELVHRRAAQIGDMDMMRKLETKARDRNISIDPIALGSNHIYCAAMNDEREKLDELLERFVNENGQEHRRQAWSARLVGAAASGNPVDLHVAIEKCPTDVFEALVKRDRIINIIRLDVPHEAVFDAIRVFVEKNFRKRPIVCTHIVGRLSRMVIPSDSCAMQRLHEVESFVVNGQSEIAAILLSEWIFQDDKLKGLFDQLFDFLCEKMPADLEPIKKTYRLLYVCSAELCEQLAEKWWRKKIMTSNTLDPSQKLEIFRYMVEFIDPLRCKLSLLKPLFKSSKRSEPFSKAIARLVRSLNYDISLMETDDFIDFIVGPTIAEVKAVDEQLRVLTEHGYQMPMVWTILNRYLGWLASNDSENANLLDLQRWLNDNHNELALTSRPQSLRLRNAVMMKHYRVIENVMKNFTYLPIGDVKRLFDPMLRDWYGYDSTKSARFLRIVAAAKRNNPKAPLDILWGRHLLPVIVNELSVSKDISTVEPMTIRFHQWWFGVPTAWRSTTWLPSEMSDRWKWINAAGTMVITFADGDQVKLLENLESFLGWLLILYKLQVLGRRSDETTSLRLIATICEQKSPEAIATALKAFFMILPMTGWPNGALALLIEAKKKGKMGDVVQQLQKAISASRLNNFMLLTFLCTGQLDRAQRVLKKMDLTPDILWNLLKDFRLFRGYAILPPEWPSKFVLFCLENTNISQNAELVDLLQAYTFEMLITREYDTNDLRWNRIYEILTISRLLHSNKVPFNAKEIWNWLSVDRKEVNVAMDTLIANPKFGQSAQELKEAAATCPDRSAELNLNVRLRCYSQPTFSK